MAHELIPVFVLIAMLICYSTKIIPIGATSIIGCGVMVLLGYITLQSATSQFVSDVVLLQIGVMIIGDAFLEVGLSERIGSIIAKIFGRNEKTFLIIIIIVAIAISAFISNTATVAMLLPVIAAAEQNSKGEIRKKSLTMAVGFASVLGGNIALFSSTPQLGVQDILLHSTIEGVHGLGIFELAPVAIPLAILLPLFYLIVGDRLQKKIFDYSKSDFCEVTSVIVAGRKPVYKEIIVCVIYALCIVCFVGGWIPIGATAVIGALLCVVTGCINEKRALASLDWTIVVMLGGILAFSDGFTKSGAGAFIVEKALSLFSTNAANPLLLYAILVILAVVLTNVMSNTAVAVMLTPIGINIAANIGANPMTFVIGIIISSNISFCTPIATAPVAMTLRTGYKFSDYFKLGGLFTIIAVCYTIFVIPLFYGF